MGSLHGINDELEAWNVDWGRTIWGAFLSWADRRTEDS